MHKKVLIFFSIISFIIVGCKREANSAGDQMSQYEDFSVKMQNVFYSLPSPMEIANLIEESALNFDPAYLHDIEDYSLYETEEGLAINLGVYSADLSFAIVFKQKEYISKYYNIVTKLSDKLGLLESVSDSLVDLIHQNLENPVRLQQLISEVFFRTDAFLENSNRENIATLMFFGGWLETMYLTLSFTNNVAYQDSANRQIFELIADQYYIIDDLIDMVKMSDISDKLQIIDDLTIIEKQIKQLTTVSYHNQYDPIADTIVRVCQRHYNIDEPKLKQLLSTVSEIRNKYINLR